MRLLEDYACDITVAVIVDLFSDNSISTASVLYHHPDLQTKTQTMPVDLYVGEVMVCKKAPGNSD